MHETKYLQLDKIQSHPTAVETSDFVFSFFPRW